MKFYFLLKLRTYERRKVFYFFRCYRYIPVIAIIIEQIKSEELRNELPEIRHRRLFRNDVFRERIKQWEKGC